jgi:hypothetical protein
MMNDRYWDWRLSFVMYIWYLVVVDGHFGAAMLQLLMLVEYVAFR